jgi:membrane protein required for colicin V production
MVVAVADVVCAAILLVAGLRAGIRGFVVETFTLGAIAVGIAVAIVGHPLAAQQLETWWETAWWHRPLAFVALFVASYLVVKLLEAISQRACAALRLKGLDHILGFGVGVAEGLIVVYGFLVLVQVQTVIDTGPWFADSLVRELVLPWMLANLPFPELPAPESATI